MYEIDSNLIRKGKEEDLKLSINNLENLCKDATTFSGRIQFNFKAYKEKRKLYKNDICEKNLEEYDLRVKDILSKLNVLPEFIILD